MSLAEVVMSSRGEHVIYISLPVSLGVFLSALYADDFVSGLTIVSIITSLMTILLYELRIDEWMVRRWYSRPWKNEDELEKALISWDILLRTWHVIIRDPPEFFQLENMLADKVRRLTASVVRSRSIDRRLWPIRATMYLFASIPLIIASGLMVIVRWPGIVSIPLFEFLITADTLPATVLILTVLFWIFQYLINWKRHSQLRDDIFDLVIFRYAQQIVAYDALENPRKYSDSGDPLCRNLLNELDYIDNVVVLGDWFTFTERWNPVRTKIEISARTRFYRVILSELLQFWGKHTVFDQQGRYRNDEDLIGSARVLGWTIHYISMFSRMTTRNVDWCTMQIIDLAKSLYLEDCRRTKRCPEPSSVLDRMLGHDSEGTRIEYKLRQLPRLSNPILVFSRVDQTILLPTKKKPCYSQQREFLQFIYETLSSLSARMSGLQQSTESTGETPDNPSLSAICRLILDVFRLSFENHRKIGVWNMLSKDEQLEMLHSLHDRLEEHDPNSEFVYVLASLLKESKYSLMEELKNQQTWQPYFSKYPDILSLGRSIN